MSELILHQYAESTFSEKVRLLLGYKGASYQQVETSIIMPRPDLMPLTGGYRRIPVMQIGADVYCDTALMCRVIDDMYPDNTVYPESSIAATEAVALWTDTFFFKVCVAIAFQPSALATEPMFADEAAAAEFMADRAQLTEGSSELAMTFDVAEPHFLGHLTNLDQQLGRSSFLFGDAPTIADFSTYHLIWFVHQREVLRDYFEPFDNLRRWFDRMTAFGHGDVEVISGEAALSIANSTAPVEFEDAAFIGELKAGQSVSVMPIDYGFQAVTGELLAAGLDEIAIARSDEQAGRVVVHFPRTGFQVIPQ